MISLNKAFPDQDLDDTENYLTMGFYLQDGFFHMGFERWCRDDYVGQFGDYVEALTLVDALNILDVVLNNVKEVKVPQTIEQNGYTYALVGKTK